MINKFTGIQWIGIHYVPLSESGKREMARESEYIYVMNAWAKLARGKGTFE